MTELIETGVKAVDLYAPLPRSGRLAINAEPGAGGLVLAMEIVHNLCRGGAVARFVTGDDPEQLRRALREADVAADVLAGEGPTRAEVRSQGTVLATVVLGEDAGAQAQVTVDRALLQQGQLPAVAAAGSSSSAASGDHARLADAARRAIAEGRGAGVLAFLRQWFHVAEPWTGQPGEYSTLAQTLDGVRQLVSPTA